MTENNNNLSKQIEAALDSLNNIRRALPKPYLLTRITARLDLKTKTIWEKAACIISRPMVMALGLSLLIAINISVILINNASKNKVADRSISSISEDGEYSIPYLTIENNETP